VVALQAVMLDGDDGDLAATTVTYYLSTVRGATVTYTNRSHFATWSIPIGWYTSTRAGNHTELIYCEAPHRLI
jgi:hypothetical protein